MSFQQKRGQRRALKATVYFTAAATAAIGTMLLVNHMIHEEPDMSGLSSRESFTQKAAPLAGVGGGIVALGLFGMGVSNTLRAQRHFGGELRHTYPTKALH